MENRNIDGTLKKGHSGLKPKGAISTKTAIWNEIGEFFTTGLLQDYVKALQELKENDTEEFMKRYEIMLEYFAPKLSRSSIDHSGKVDTSPQFDISKLDDNELRTLAELQRKGGTSKA
jgi:hypothetical protein